VNGICPGGDLLAGADDPHDLRPDALDRDVQRLQHASGEALLLAQQAQKDVLGADVVVLERARLLLREDDHLPGSFCKSLEHGVVPSSRVVPQALFDPSYASRQSTNRPPELRRVSRASPGTARPRGSSRARSTASRAGRSRPDPAGRRHSLLKRLHEQLVVWLDRLLAERSQSLLGAEALALDVSIDQLAERIRDLDPAGERLPTLDQAQLGAVLAGERGELDRVVERRTSAGSGSARHTSTADHRPAAAR